MKIGSEAHKELFCRSFLDNHKKYEPENLPWPELDEIALQRLRAIPFWVEALATEQKAGAMINAYTETIQDPLVKEAIALQGREESRHARLIQFLIEHYGVEIVAPPLKPVPDKIEPAFIKFGFNECVDSFLAFGIFKLARQSHFFPDPLFDIFDNVLDEEASHIVFFINWFAYLQASRGQDNKILGAGKNLWYYGKAVKHLVGIAGNTNSDKPKKSMTFKGSGTFIENLTPQGFLSACLEENTRRLSRFDERLLRPQLLNAIAKVALNTLNLLPSQQPQSKVAKS